MLLARQQLLQARRAIENQMRGKLKTLGAMTGSTKGRRFLPRVIALRAEQDWLGPVLDPLLATHAAIAKQLKAVTDSILRAAREDADVRRLMTVPGIGAMTALAYKAAIDDPKRFTSSVKVGPYLGLTPRQHQSGGERMDRRHRQDQRSPAAQLPLRGRRRADDAGAPLLSAEGLGRCGSPSASAGS